MKYYLFICIFIVAASQSNLCFSQKNNKELKESRKITVWSERVSEKLPAVLSEETFFDESGRKTRVNNYNKEGILKSYETFGYDAQGNLVREEEFSSKGKLEKRKDYEYKNGIKTKELHYNGQGSLDKSYEYEYSGSHKTKRTEKDSKSRIVTIKTYKYE